MSPADDEGRTYASGEGLVEFLDLMRLMRERCVWKSSQTHASLAQYLREESDEVLEAIDEADPEHLKEELGDLLLQVLFHSVVAEERGAFDFGDVAEGFLRKMKSRHPHLYEGGERQRWEEMKAKKRDSIVDGLPADLPSLHRAFRLQDRAAGIGFDWPDATGAAEKVEEELAEVREEVARGGLPSAYGVPDERLEEELGDLLFAVVNLSRKLGVHPSLALDKANVKFAARFQGIERLARERGIDVKSAGLDVLDGLWEEVKKQ